jgi:hypothetical protein
MAPAAKVSERLPPTFLQAHNQCQPWTTLNSTKLMQHLPDHLGDAALALLGARTVTVPAPSQLTTHTTQETISAARAAAAVQQSEGQKQATGTGRHVIPGQIAAGAVTPAISTASPKERAFLLKEEHRAVAQLCPSWLIYQGTNFTPKFIAP